jgi:hypothetical protein
MRCFRKANSDVSGISERVRDETKTEPMRITYRRDYSLVELRP